MDEKIKIKIGGQISIWIILGVILVASLLLFFLIDRGIDLIKPGEGDISFDFQSYIDKCVTKDVNEAVSLMFLHGGFIEPSANSVIYAGEKVEYLCKNINYYKPCVQQHPLLMQEMETEIRNYIGGRMQQCFLDMEEEAENRNAKVEFDNDLTQMAIGIKLLPDKIVVKIVQDATIEKQGEIRKINEINVDVQSPLYDLSKLAMEIASQEAEFGYFHYIGYNKISTRLKVDEHTLSGSKATIYTIRDEKSGKEMRFATRSVVIPSGFDIGNG